MALVSRFKHFLRAVYSAASPYTGGNEALIDVDVTLADGNGDNQASKLHSSSFTVGSGANTDKDLSTLTGPDGVAQNPADIVVLDIESPATNTTNITVSPSGSNGWTAFIGASSSIVLKPGARVTLYAPKDASYAVSGSNKSLNFANSSGATATVNLTFLGRA